MIIALIRQTIPQAEKEAKEEQRAKEIAEQMKNRPKLDVEENAAFERKLEPLGLKVKAIASDGNCLFNAIADQLQRTTKSTKLGFDYYQVLRKQASDYMWQHKDEFKMFVETDEDMDDGENLV